MWLLAISYMLMIACSGTALVLAFMREAIMARGRRYSKVNTYAIRLQATTRVAKLGEL